MGINEKKKAPCILLRKEYYAGRELNTRRPAAGLRGRWGKYFRVQLAIYSSAWRAVTLESKPTVAGRLAGR